MAGSGCPDREKITALLAARLDEETSAALWRHIETCDQCQVTYLMGAPAEEGETLRASRVPQVAEEGPKFDLDEGVSGLIGGLLHYEIHEPIGAGGMGVVYRAVDLRLDRPVAIKTLHAQHGDRFPLRLRFLFEARLMARLQHPGIPPVHELGTLPDGRPFLAMKLVAGRTLAELLRERPDPQSDRPRYLAIFEAVCEAVAYAHEQGIVHRDLKPGNIMVGQFGEVQVMDWGLAKAYSSSATSPKSTPGGSARTTQSVAFETPRQSALATLAGAVLGTPGYAPPEQLRGQLDCIGPWSDVFSLGAILCVILTGRPPYDGQSVLRSPQTARQPDLREAFRRLDQSGADPELVALCKRCLALDPAERPGSARDVAERVVEIRAQAEERARRAELERAAAEVRLTEQIRRRRIWFALACVAVLGALTSALLAAWAWKARSAAIAAREAERQARLNEARLRRIAEQKEAEAVRAAELARRAQREAEFRMARLSDAMDLLQEAFAGINVTALREQDRPLEEILGERFRSLAQRLVEQEGEDPVAHAAMLHGLGESLFSLGHYRDAARLLHRAAELRAGSLGPTHPDTLRSRLSYGQSLISLGQYTEAEALLRELHAQAMKLFGPDDPIRRKSLVALGYVLYLQGKGEECTDVLAPVADALLEKRRLDETDIDLIEVYAEGFAARAEFARARELLKRVYAERDRLFGPTHPQTLLALNNLAVVTLRTGDLQQALPLFERGYRLAQSRLGPDHPSVLTQLNNLGLAYQVAGEFDKAIEALSRCLRLTEQRLGPDHPHTAQSMNNLAVLYERLGRLDEAEPLYERALGLREKLLGPDHPQTINTRFSLGVVRLKLGKTDEGLRLLRATLESLKRRKFAHDRAPRLVDHVAGCLEEEGHWHDAAQWRRAWIEALRNAGAAQDQVDVQLVLLARDLVEQGELDEAVRAANQVARRAGSAGAPTWATAFARGIAAAVALQRGDDVGKAIEEIENALRELLGVSSSVPPERRDLAVKFLFRRLIDHARATGDTESLRKWEQELAKYEAAMGEKNP